MTIDSPDQHRNLKPKFENPALQGADLQEQDNPLVNHLVPDDWKVPQQLAPDNQEHQLESNGTLPRTRVSVPSAQEVLTNPQASSQDKLQAVAALGRCGAASVTLTDQDGTKRECRVELEQSGNKTLVHLFTQDQHGKERVILRGVDNGDGTFSREIGKGGREVSFTGTWWSSHMSGKSSLGCADESSANQLQSRHEQPHQPGEARFDWFAQHPQFNPDDSNTESQQQWNNYFNQMADNAQNQGKHMEQLPDGSVYIQAGMAIDADGAPDATQIDPAASCHTSLRHPDGSSVNAREVPYFVLPLSKYQKYGIHKGDIAAVRYNGKVEFAVFADVGQSHKLGEGSMALAQALGINNSPTRGGVNHGVEYIVFPGSGDGTPGTPHQNRQRGGQLLASHAKRLSGNATG